METFSALLAIHRSPMNSPHKGQGRGALMFSLIYVWINGWVNNGEAGDLRRYRAHYDVSVVYYADASLWIRHSQPGTHAIRKLANGIKIHNIDRTLACEVNHVSVFNSMLN